MPSINDMDVQRFFQTAHKLPVSTLFLSWLCCLVLSLAAGAYLFWVPQLEQLKQGSEQIKTELVKLESDMQLLTQLAQLEAELVEYRLLLPRLQGALPQGREVPELLRTIYLEIGRNHLALLNFEPQAEEDTGVLTRVPVKLSASGAGESVARLPLMVSALTRKAAFNEFDMKRDEKSGQWSVEGSLVAFAQPKAVSSPGPAVHGGGQVPLASLSTVKTSEGVQP